MRCYCPYCGGRIPGRPGQYIKCMHCSERLLWCDDKAFRNREDIEKYLLAVRLTEQQPSELGPWRRLAGMILFLWRSALASPSRCLRAAQAFGTAGWQKVTAASQNVCIFCAPARACSLGPSAASLLANYATKSRGLRLNRLAALDPETALILSTYPGDLYLNGITSLVPEVAKSLSQHRGVLSLNGVAELSVAAAEQLIKHGGRIDMLELNPSPSMARLLSRHHTINLSPNARAIMKAESVLRRTVRRQVGNHQQGNPASSQRPVRRGSASAEVRVLTPKLAKRLAASKKDCLNLDSYKEILPFAARIVAAHPDELSLNGLVRLSPSIANELARHVGDLSLNGVFDLTTECAKALASHRGGIEMNGLLSLLPDCATALERHNHWLSLNGLSRVSDDTAARLARHPGNLQLNGIRRLSSSVAKQLSQHRHWLQLDGVEFVDADVAKELARFRGTQLWLRGLINADAEPEVVATLRRNPSILLLPAKV
jgi:hypothetical protein